MLCHKLYLPPLTEIPILVILQGMSSIVDFDANLESYIGRSKMLVVEGYLWEIPETVQAIARACAAARAKGGGGGAYRK